MSRVISRAVVDLPQPLSPTRPKTLPSGTVKEIRSTALRICRPINRLGQPPLTSKCLTNSLTSSSDIMHQENDRKPNCQEISLRVAAFQSGNAPAPWRSAGEIYSRAADRTNCTRCPESHAMIHGAAQDGEW